VIHVLADSGVNTTVVAAFAVGFVSFISPCVLPLVPGYLSAISGVSFAELQEGENRKKVIGPALLFCLSFTVIFVILGMFAQQIGSRISIIENVAGVMLIAMGLFFVLTPFVPRLNREWRPDVLIQRAGTGGPIIAGLAFAIAWTPCIGPTLASILAAAATSKTVGHGGVLLAFYSAGLAIPFLLTAIAFDRATNAFRWIRERYLLVTAISGCVLVAMGVLILSGELTRLNVEAQQWLSSLGLDFLYKV